MINLRFREYTEDEDIERLALLADEIWHECFPDIISDQQIDYMVEKFQSAEAMKRQISEEDYRYFAVEIDGSPVGYYGVAPYDDNTLFLSKLYLHEKWRGKGLARLMYKEIRKIARSQGREFIRLTVNKNNVHAINVYKHMGMIVIDEQCTDIGEGFVMDDYVFGRML